MLILFCILSTFSALHLEEFQFDPDFQDAMKPVPLLVCI